MAEINAEMERRTEAGYLDIKEWFEHLKQHRPPGATQLTDGILQKAGPPPLPKPHEEYPGHGAVIMARAAVRSYGEENLKRMSALAYTTGKDEHLSSFWASVRNYLSTVR
ncbi:hypothetical protein [Pseudarthrobacter sp. NCCP-2145]|uniref:hypothetical protein n=1 Tax=Pseudarthrobacter sp. NCCP-2145 TaxID=2942290 RepID=UPI002040D39F|nr:hypothetical protein [Pseudarthrobacter sp. NCCP-2145]